MSLFPAYGRGRGGGRGRGQQGYGGGGHHHRSHQRFQDGPHGDGRNDSSSSFGYMIDRGDAPSSSGQAFRGGNRGGHNNRGRFQQDHHGSRGGYGTEVVDIEPSDDDNDVEDAVSSSRDHKRKRHSHSSHSHSSSKKKKRKRERSRSRSPQSRHHHHHHSSRRQEGNGSQRQGNQQQQQWGNDRDSHRNQHHREGRWDRQHQQQEFQDDQQYNNFAGSNRGRDWDRDPRDRGYSDWSSQGAPPGPNPWVLDENPFDQFQQQQQQQHYYRGQDQSTNRDGNGGRDSRRNYGGGRNERERHHEQRRRQNSYESQQEERRLQVSTAFPKKVFLEEVDLPMEYAFRLDTNSNPTQMNFRTLGQTQKSAYQFERGIFGATDDEMSKVYSVFHSFRCKLPDAVDSFEGEDSQEDSGTLNKTSAKQYFSLDGNPNSSKKKKFDQVDEDKNAGRGKKGDDEMSVRDKIEYFNKEVRSQPQNIALWKEFVQFQDRVFAELDEKDEEEGPTLTKRADKKRKKSNRKALLEKKIAILEKALETNPKNLELHLLRLEYLLELFKPRHVQTEWKKLVSQYQQIAPFWMEYLLFSASQLLIFSNSNTLSTFDTCFQKFRLMLNPQYPEFQRPPKFPLLISDITFALSLLMKNAGYMERAVAVHQAQLEFDFFCPQDLFKDDSLLNWKDESGVFEKFWEAGTPRFGEYGGQGWKNYSENPSEQHYDSSALSDSKIAKFEENIFESLNEHMDELRKKQEHKPETWLNIESCRSKLYWTPWRLSCSDAEECDDTQRTVLFSDIANFISPVPHVNFISDFDRQATYFRHICNFLLTLREDFVTHTQTVDLALSPFFALSLTESSSLFNEIYYWRRVADLYVGVNPEPASKSHHVFAPEGFKILDLVSPSLTVASVLRPSLFDLSQKVDGFDQKKLDLLKENDEKFMEMFHRVLQTGIELLEPDFACALFEMFLRFEQKLACTRSEDMKQRIKFAKEIMKHEKVRNSVGGYREMAMLEYFGGNSKKAKSVLVKAINATCKTLNSKEWDNVGWDKDWRMITDLISMYRQLVELSLQSSEDCYAFYVLVQLGNCFQAVETIEDDWKPTTTVLLKATRSFEKIMSTLLPTFSKDSDGGDETESELVTDEVYFKWGGEKCVEFLLQQRNLIVECTTAYALFQVFSKDFESASQVFEKVLRLLGKDQLSRRDGYNPELIRIHIREQLYINWCNLAARCLTKDPLMNSKFRNILGRSLEEFPSSPPLLLLFTDVENQTSVAGKLWRLMMANMKQDSEKIITHWPPLIMGIGLARKIEELEHDEEVGLPSFGIGGPAVPQDTIFYKLDSMISVAEAHPGARHCPLLWRVHLKLLALRAREGKDIQRARATFYDAVRHCPSSKALYLDGVTYFPDLMSEVNDLVAEKQILVRLPVEELDVLLEIDEEMVQDSTNKNGSENENEDEGEVDFSNRRKSRESKSEGELGESD